LRRLDCSNTFSLVEVFQQGASKQRLEALRSRSARSSLTARLRAATGGALRRPPRHPEGLQGEWLGDFHEQCERSSRRQRFLRSRRRRPADQVADCWQTVQRLFSPLSLLCLRAGVWASAPPVGRPELIIDDKHAQRLVCVGYMTVNRRIRVNRRNLGQTPQFDLALRRGAMAMNQQEQGR
jgi:hypothetical protein